MAEDEPTFKVVTLEERINSGISPPPGHAFSHSVKLAELCAAGESPSGNVQVGNLPTEWPLARISVYMHHVSVLLRVTLYRRLAELSFKGVDFQHLPREVVKHAKEDFDTICGAMASQLAALFAFRIQANEVSCGGHSRGRRHSHS